MATSPVFHPGHDALHGMTVVVFTKTPRTFVGRWDAEEGGNVALNAVAMHEADRDPKSREHWLAETKKYGVAVAFPRLTVPAKDIERVVKLGDLAVQEL